MLIDETNRIVQLCAVGMTVEGDTQQADALFRQAWQEAETDVEQCIAAHYVARRQSNVGDKLAWDLIALEAALKADRASVKDFLPSLYLNVAKGYEDISEPAKALACYRFAMELSLQLPEDGYSRMIRTGIQNGLARVNA